MPEEVPPPSLSTYQPTGLISNPIGNVATEQEGTAIFPSTAFEGQDWFGLTKQVGRWAERGAAEGIPEAGIEAQPKLDPDTLNKTYGIPGHLKFDSPVAGSVAQSMEEAKRAELAREDAAARTPDGFWPQAARMGAGFVAGALDPLNIAATFMPVVGEARVAAMLGKAGIGALGEDVLADVGVAGASAIPSLGARLAVRGATGAIGGAIGQAPLVGLRYGLSQQEHADYSAMDALGDVIMGGALGAGLHIGGGVLGDVFRGGEAPRAAQAHAEALREAGVSPEVAAAEAARPPGLTPDEEAMLREINSSPETAEAASRTAVAQMAQGFPVDVTPVIDAEHAGRAEFMAQAAQPEGAGAELPSEGTATPFERQPREPQRLASFLRANGGVNDEGGDVRVSLGRAMDRPGLINQRGLSLDKATQLAWDAGYFPEHDQRPTINDLLDRLHEDVRGNPQYSSHDEGGVAAFREAMAHNSEVDRIASQTGVDPAGKTREQFFDAVADHVSQEERAGMVGRAEMAHAEAYAEFERLAKEHVEAQGGTWHPAEFYNSDQSRSLEDLEHEYREEATSATAGQRGVGAVQSGLAGQSAGGGETSSRSGGRSAGIAGRAGQEGVRLGSPEPSPAFDRAAGYAHGRMTPEESSLAGMADLATKTIKPDVPNEISPDLQASIEDTHAFLAGAEENGLLTDVDRAEMAGADSWVQQATEFGKGIVRAGMCLMRGGG